MNGVQFDGGVGAGTGHSAACKPLARGRGWSRAVPGGVGAVLLAALATAVAGCGSAPAASRAADAGTTGTAARTGAAGAGASAAPLAAGHVGSRQDVPWARVGQGWFLADWSRSAPAWPGHHVRPSATSLFLVDPAGGRYRITSFPADAGQKLIPESVVAWSGDGQRALLYDGANAALLNLRTGASITLTLDKGETPIGFTRPDGLAILADFGLGNQRLERLSLTGMKEVAYPTTFTAGAAYDGSALETPDGTQLVVGTDGDGLELLDNNGQTVRYLPVSPSVQGCAPLRWWTANDVVLARCTPKGTPSSQLWLVPTAARRAGTYPSPLTARRPAHGDLGDVDAWELFQGTNQAPIGAWAQDLGACGVTYVAKLGPTGRTTPVTIPTLQGSTDIVGAQGNRLAVTSRPACGDGGALVWFTPLGNSVSPLLGGAMNHGSVQAAVMFGQP